MSLFESYAFCPTNYIISVAGGGWGGGCSLKGIFGKLRLRDGLVWTESLTGEIQLRFQRVNVERPSIWLAASTHRLRYFVTHRVRKNATSLAISFSFRSREWEFARDTETDKRVTGHERGFCERKIQVAR